jgi:hypothetical protein
MDNVRRRGTWILACCAAVTVGCNASKPEFVSARIVVLPTHVPGLLRATELEIDDPVEVKRLASFFPQFGRTQYTFGGAGWKHAIRITFATESGDTCTANLDFTMEVWSEDRGDWDLPPEFKEYLTSLLREHEKSPSGSTQPQDARPR